MLLNCPAAPTPLTIAPLWPFQQPSMAWVSYLKAPGWPGANWKMASWWSWAGKNSFRAAGKSILFPTEPAKARYRKSKNFVIGRSEEHTSELQSLMRISYAVFCLKKKKKIQHDIN